MRISTALSILGVLTAGPTFMNMKTYSAEPFSVGLAAAGIETLRSAEDSPVRLIEAPAAVAFIAAGHALHKVSGGPG